MKEKVLMVNLLLGEGGWGAACEIEMRFSKEKKINYNLQKNKEIHAWKANSTGKRLPKFLLFRNAANYRLHQLFPQAIRNSLWNSKTTVYVFKQWDM